MLETVVAEKITKIAEQVVNSFQFDLVDLEFRREGRKLILCLYIDKPGGVTLDDCATASHEFSAVLDAEDIIAERFTLEVSSPGLNRPLKKLADFTAAIGKLIRVKTNGIWQDGAGNKRKTFLGVLVEVRNDDLILDLKEGQQAIVPLTMVAKANLEYEF